MGSSQDICLPLSLRFLATRVNVRVQKQTEKYIRDNRFGTAELSGQLNSNKHCFQIPTPQATHGKCATR